MDIKVMSFNLRFATEKDGINFFWNRTEKIKSVIQGENPDLIGFQEITDPMREWIQDNLPGYVLLGCGRNSDYHGESTVLAYKKGAFILISLENKWLSLTPDVPGSFYGDDQGSCPRMYTSATLKRDGVDAPFVFINTHLDHKGPRARLWEARTLVGYLATKMESGAKVILTGDFNASPDSPEMRLFTEAGIGLTDCTLKLGNTYHGYGLYDTCVPVTPGVGTPNKIDYIFTNAACGEAYAIADAHQDGIYYSDHNAVCATVIL